MARSNSTAAVLATLLLAMALTACVKPGHTYSRYMSVGSGGWLREDTVDIVFGPVSHSGQYYEELGLRTSSLYPFMELALIAVQQARPSGFSRTDTLCVSLTDDDGHVIGDGISHYQYLFPLKPATLADGDTLTIRIRHNMLRSPLAGVTDVGFTIRH